MNSQLGELFQCDELDDLKEQVEALQEIDIQDVKEIDYVLQNEVDIQAVANIMMNLNAFEHPDLESAYYIIKGFTSENEYIVLATVIGAQNLSKADIGEADEQKIIDSLIALLSHQRPIIRQRASVSLANYPLLGSVVEELLLAYKIDDPIVKHNLLVMLIDVEGLNAASRLLNNLLTEETLYVSDQQFWDDRLAKIDHLLQDNPVDPMKLLMSSVGSTQLSYIPNFKEWQ